MVRILLIEDDTLLAEMYKRAFVAAGFIIDACIEGKTGLSLLQSHQYDLVLLDVLLPDIDGLEVFKQIKAQISKTLPVVFLTNLSQDNTIAKAFELGAKGYLVKASYTPDQVVSEVKNFLEQNKTISTQT